MFNEHRLQLQPYPLCHPIKHIIIEVKPGKIVAKFDWLAEGYGVFKDDISIVYSVYKYAEMFRNIIISGVQDINYIVKYIRHYMYDFY